MGIYCFNCILEREERNIDVKEVELIDRERKDNNGSGRKTTTASWVRQSATAIATTVTLANKTTTTTSNTTGTYGYELVIF